MLSGTQIANAQASRSLVTMPMRRLLLLSILLLGCKSITAPPSRLMLAVANETTDTASAYLNVDSLFHGGIVPPGRSSCIVAPMGKSAWIFGNEINSSNGADGFYQSPVFDPATQPNWSMTITPGPTSGAVAEFSVVRSATGC